MASKVYADVVVGIPFGDGTKKRWLKIGAMLEMSQNDSSRGPGFVIMLDRHVNLAGLPSLPNSDGTSIAASTFWPKEPEGTSTPRPGRTPSPKPQSRPRFDDDDDDIPF